MLARPQSPDSDQFESTKEDSNNESIPMDTYIQMTVERLVLLPEWKQTTQCDPRILITLATPTILLQLTESRKGTWPNARNGVRTVKPMPRNYCGVMYTADTISEL